MDKEGSKQPVVPVPASRLRSVMLAVVAIALMLGLMEVGAVTLLAVRKYVKKQPMDALVSRVFWLSPFTARPSDWYRAAPQTDLGILGSDSGEKWKDFLPADSLLGWRLAPNIKVQQGAERYTYITNEQGFMSIGSAQFYYDPIKPAGVVRIVLLGGSTLMGQGAFTPSENLPARILRALQERYPKTAFEVINAGVGGYVSSQETLYFISELVRYQPDIVMVYNGWNDQSSNNRVLEQHENQVGFLKTAEHYKFDLRLADSYTWTGSLHLFGEMTFSSLKSRLGFTGLGILMRGFASGSPLGHDEKFTYFNPLSVKMYKDNLETDVMISRYRGFKVALFLQPIMGVHPKQFTAEEKAWNEKINDMQVRTAFYDGARKMFKGIGDEHKGDRNVCVADLSQVLSRAEGTVYADSGHLFVAGNDIVAAGIVEHLDKCGFVER